jgi:hypothetical protein
MINKTDRANMSHPVSASDAVLPADGWTAKIRPIAAGDKPVSANEATSLSALIAYVAYNTGASEFRIERNLADRFNIANVKCLPSKRFDDAMRYLVDQTSTPIAA